MFVPVASCAGMALLVGTISAWIGAIVFLITCDRWYVPFEERKMLLVFGDEYESYRRRVRRWIGRRSSVRIGD